VEVKKRVAMVNSRTELAPPKEIECPGARTTWLWSKGSSRGRKAYLKRGGKKKAKEMGYRRECNFWERKNCGAGLLQIRLLKTCGKKKHQHKGGHQKGDEKRKEKKLH